MEATATASTAEASEGTCGGSMDSCSGGCGQWDGEAEDLPLPGRASAAHADPFGPVSGYYMPYDSHDVYGGCGHGVGCGDPCCGDPCCHPADCCNEDLLCIGPGDNESCHTIRVRVPKVQEAMTDENAIKAIKEGIVEKGKKLMDPYADKLGDDEIKALVAHMRTFKK